MNAQEIIETLLKHSKLNASQFAKAIGAKTNQAIYDMQKGRTKAISPAMADKIVSCFPEINRMWLISGEGTMLRTDASAAAGGEATTTEDGERTGETRRVRYYPEVTASMGNVDFLDTPDEHSVWVEVPREFGVDDGAIMIKAFGDSMSPLITSGQLIFIRPWTERFVEWGEIYLVVTRTGQRTIKRLFPCPGDDACIECRSENAAAHPSFTVPKADIVRLFLVCVSVNRLRT